MGDKAMTYSNGKMKRAGDTDTVDLDGHVNLGNSTTDDIVIGGEIKSNILPDATDTYDLGSNSKSWRHLYLDGTAKLTSLKVNVNGTGNSSGWTYSVSSDDCFIMCEGSGSRTVNLPTASGKSGRILIIKDVVGNAGANTITISANGGDSLEGGANLDENGAGVVLICDGSGWYIVARV